MGIWLNFVVVLYSLLIIINFGCFYFLTVIAVKIIVKILVQNCIAFFIFEKNYRKFRHVI